MVVKALELNPRQDELKLTMEDLSSNMERVSVTNSEQSSSSPSQGSILENSMEDPHHLSGMPIELKKLLAKRRKSDIPGEDSSRYDV